MDYSDRDREEGGVLSWEREWENRELTDAAYERLMSSAEVKALGEETRARLQAAGLDKLVADPIPPAREQQSRAWPVAGEACEHWGLVRQVVPVAGDGDDVDPRARRRRRGAEEWRRVGQVAHDGIERAMVERHQNRCATQL